MPLVGFLVIGVVCMIACMLYMAWPWKTITIPKIVIIAAVMPIIGVLGSYGMYFIENGKWDGRSFYGAVFLMPVLMYPVAKLLKVGYGEALDLCIPAGCISHALIKVKCSIDGCCYGRAFIINSRRVRFPSQKVECVAALVLMAVLLVMAKKGKWKGKIYFWYLILYGASRFVLEFFRDTDPWIGPLSAGSFWSLISIAIGAAALLYSRKLDEGETMKERSL